MGIEVRLAKPNEFDDVAELISRFSADRLTSEERKEGFVQGRFTTKMVEWFASSLCVLIATDETQIIAALCACSLQDNRLPPPIATLKNQLPDWRLHGRPIDAERCLAYGPVCVDRPHQRRGIVRLLYEELLRIAGPKYLFGVAFVDRENKTSLQVHCDGLGMAVLGNYVSDGNSLVALGFEVHRPERS